MFLAPPPSFGSKKRQVEITAMDVVMLLLRPTQNSAIFKSRQKMSRRTRLRGTTTDTFWEMDLHSEKYRIEETLERFYFDVVHHAHNKSTTNNNNENGTTFCNDRKDYKVLPVVDASHFCAKNATCLETLEVDDAQQIEEPFEAWMDAIKKMAVIKERENEENRKILRLLDQLYPGSKKRSKKSIINMYVRHMHERLSEYF